LCIMRREKIMTKEVGGRKQPAKTVLALLVVSSAFLTNLIAQGIDTTAYFPLSVGDTYTYYQSSPVRQTLFGNELARGP